MTLARADEIDTLFPDLRWPHKPDGTLRLARLGRLKRIVSGRGIYFTRELLEEYLRSNIVSEARPAKPFSEDKLAARRAKRSGTAAAVQP